MMGRRVNPSYPIRLHVTLIQCLSVKHFEEDLAISVNSNVLQNVILI